MPEPAERDDQDPSLRGRFALAVLMAGLLVAGARWDSDPAALRWLVLAVPAAYLLTEVWVFLRGLGRPPADG